VEGGALGDEAAPEVEAAPEAEAAPEDGERGSSLYPPLVPRLGTEADIGREEYF
jgi:hypothetical protein